MFNDTGSFSQNEIVKVSSGEQVVDCPYCGCM